MNEPIHQPEAVPVYESSDNPEAITTSQNNNPNMNIVLYIFAFIMLCIVIGVFFMSKNQNKNQAPSVPAYVSPTTGSQITPTPTTQPVDEIEQYKQEIEGQQLNDTQLEQDFSDIDKDLDQL